MPAATPPDEAERLSALHRYGVLDTAPESAFDRITRLAARSLDVPIALISLVDADRQWFKSRLGLGVDQLPRDGAFCAHAILGDGPLVVHDALADPRFANHPLVTGPPHVRAYAGAPLRTPDGAALGTVCVLDLRPRQFSREMLAVLEDLATITVDELELRAAARDRAAAEAAAARTEESLHDRVRVLEAILQTAGEAILVVDATGKYEIFNDTAKRLLGRAPGEVAPLDRGREYGVFEADRVTAMSLDRLPLVRALRGEAVHQEHLWLRNAVNPDGIFLSATAQPLREQDGAIRGAVGTFADVTRLHEATSHLATARAELADRVEILEAVLESAGEGIMVADADGRLIVANPVGRFILGRDAGDAEFPSAQWARDVGIYRADMRTPVPIDEFPLVRAVLGEASYGVELYVRNERVPDGRFLQITGRPIRDSAGRSRGGVIVLSDISLLKYTQDQVAALALVDELTGLPNRRAFRERLELLSHEAARGRRFALTLVDIDHFKRVNDVHGHDVGDQVLVAVARTLQAHVRRSDLVARLGGEEFCVLEADVGDEAAAMAERLRAAIAAIERPVRVTASFGVGCSGVIPAEVILRAADQALYRAKRAGRNRVEIADAGDSAPSAVSAPPS